MGFLVSGDLLIATAGPFGMASLDEGFLGVLGEALVVEGILQMFEGQREVENLDI